MFQRIPQRGLLSIWRALKNRVNHDTEIFFQILESWIQIYTNWFGKMASSCLSHRYKHHLIFFQLFYYWFLFETLVYLHWKWQVENVDLIIIYFMLFWFSSLHWISCCFWSDLFCLYIFIIECSGVCLLSDYRQFLFNNGERCWFFSRAAMALLADVGVQLFFSLGLFQEWVGWLAAPQCWPGSAAGMPLFQISM